MIFFLLEKQIFYLSTLTLPIFFTLVQGARHYKKRRLSRAEPVERIYSLYSIYSKKQPKGIYTCDYRATPYIEPTMTTLRFNALLSVICYNDDATDLATARATLISIERRGRSPDRAPSERPRASERATKKQ